MAGPLGPYPGPLREGQVVDVRIRLGWFGRPVMQIQRQLSRTRFTGPAPDGVLVEVCGSTEWRDATKADAIELAQFFESLKVGC